jgi:integrase
MTDSFARALSDAKVRNSKAADKPVKLTDGGGLHLLVQPNGSKLWRYKFRVHGREGLLSIGAYPDVSLAAARELHQAAREKVAAGINPVHERQDERREAARAVVVAQAGAFGVVRQNWMDDTAEELSKRTKQQRAWAIGAYLAELEKTSVTEIKRQDVSRILLRVQKHAPTVAKRLRGWLDCIFERAIDEGLIELNPVPPAKLLKRRRANSHVAMELAAFPQWMTNLAAFQSYPFTKAALLLIVLTGCRKEEACGAEWSEFDLDAGRWEVPACRMKMRKQHVFPLSRQAVELLRHVREFSEGRRYAFPGVGTAKHINGRSLNYLMRNTRAGTETVHGFRAMFSTYMNGLKEDPDVIEMCLAHADKNTVRGVYNRYQYIDERTAMLQKWADDLDALVSKASGKPQQLYVVQPKVGFAKKQLTKIAA